MAVQIVTQFWATLTDMAPYLLMGFGVAGLLAAFVSPDLVERHLGGKGLMPTLKASVFGVPLPLCSCGVIPVAASLRRHGASRSAATAFLLSTPQTGVDSIFVTYALLGPVFAVFRPIAALLTGIIGGGAVAVLAGDEESDAPSAADCSAPCCQADAEGNRIRRALHYGFVVLPQDISGALLLGLAAAGIIAALVPAESVATLVGTGLVSMLIMMVAGIPIYVCATASVPIAAALIAKGLSPGAALVFLMTGPATNMAAIATIWRVLGRRTTLIYLATVAVFSLVCGLVLDLLFTVTGTASVHEHHASMPAAIGSACAVILLLMLVVALLKTKWPRLFGGLQSTAHAASHPPAGSEGLSLGIKGMTCHNCADAVRSALLECRGVHEVEVDLNHGRARVRGDGYNRQDLLDAVEGLGYRVVGPE